MPNDKDTVRQTTISLGAGQFEACDELGSRLGSLTVSAVVRMAVTEFLTKYRRVLDPIPESEDN